MKEGDFCEPKSNWDERRQAGAGGNLPFISI
jgi:hypothetical protein